MYTANVYRRVSEDIHIGKLADEIVNVWYVDNMK